MRASKSTYDIDAPLPVQNATLRVSFVFDLERVSSEVASLWMKGSARVVTDLMVLASVGVIAGRTVRTEFTPIDRAITCGTLRIDRGW